MKLYREGCTSCHQPHGSINAKMLTERNQTLCLKCHFEQQGLITGANPTHIYIGNRDHTSFSLRRCLLVRRLPPSHPWFARQQTLALLITRIIHNHQRHIFMKTISSFGIAKSCGTLRAAVFGCIGMLGTSFVYADSAPDNKDKSDGDFNNSIELTAGGFSVQGDAGNFHKVTAIAGTHNGGDFYGGLESLHIAQDINSRLNFTLDGRAIPEINDYDWKLALTDNKLGYIKAGYSEFRTWYNGNGGFYPSATGTASSSFAPAQSSLSVDRSSVWAEFGLRLENLPEITFRMEHQVRSGDMDSTEWASGNTAATYNYAPAFLQLDEVSDIFKLDLKHTIGNTDFGIALMYERD